MNRPSWDQYFMEVAYAASKRATCPRRQVGAVIVDSARNIISTGYNGAPPGEPHCIDVGCKMDQGHCIRTLHAEYNALIRVPTTDELPLTLYCTDQPCYQCALDIAYFGSRDEVIKKVVYDREYEKFRKPVLQLFKVHRIVISTIPQ